MLINPSNFFSAFFEMGKWILKWIESYLWNWQDVMWNVFYLLLNLGEDDFSRFPLASHHDLTQLEANKYIRKPILAKKLFLNFCVVFGFGFGYGFGVVWDVWVRVLVPWLPIHPTAQSLTLPVAATSTSELALRSIQGLATLLHILGCEIVKFIGFK